MQNETWNVHVTWKTRLTKFLKRRNSLNFVLHATRTFHVFWEFSKINHSSPNFDGKSLSDCDLWKSKVWLMRNSTGRMQHVSTHPLEQRVCCDKGRRRTLCCSTKKRVKEAEIAVISQEIVHPLEQRVCCAKRRRRTLCCSTERRVCWATPSMSSYAQEACR